MQTIGKLGRATGVKVPTIRFYEQIGLLPEADRSAGDQRLYDRATVRTAFIRHARAWVPHRGDTRSSKSIGSADQSCEAADAIAKAQLVEVERHLARLAALKAELERMVVNFAAHGTIADCRVIEVLGDHSLCTTDHQHPRSTPRSSAQGNRRNHPARFVTSA